MGGSAEPLPLPTGLGWMGLGGLWTAPTPQTETWGQM